MCRLAFQPEIWPEPFLLLALAERKRLETLRIVSAFFAITAYL